MSSDEMRPTIGPGDVARPTLGPDDVARPTLGPSDVARPTLGPSDAARPTLGPSDAARPTLGPSDVAGEAVLRPTLGPGTDEGYCLRPTLTPSAAEQRDAPLRPTLAPDDMDTLRPTLTGDTLRPTLTGDTLRPTLTGDTLRPTLTGDGGVVLRPTLQPMATEQVRPTFATDGSSENPDDSANEEVKDGATNPSGEISFVRRRSRKESTLSSGGAVFVQNRAGLSQRQVQELREVFGLFDMEGLGKVAPSFIRSCACDARLDQDNPEVWSMLADLDGDDPVDFTEFVHLVTDPLGDHFSKGGVQRMMGLFGDGASSFGLEDLTRVTGELGIEMDEEELKDLLDQAGADADDRLDLESFYAVLKPPGSDSDSE